MMETHLGVTNRIVNCKAPESGVPSMDRKCLFTLKTKTKELINPFQINEMFQLDFLERLTDTCPLSQEDKTFLRKIKEEIHQRKEDHYEMPILFRLPSLLNNKSLALRCLHKLGQIFENEEIITKGYAGKVPREEASINNGH